MDDIKDRLKESYGLLFEPALVDEIVEVSKLNHAKAGDVLMDYGNNIKSMPLLLDGAIKILRQDAEGDELVIYYLEKGDTCTVTMTCCMGQKQSEIRGVVVSDVNFLSIPIGKMKEWMKKYDTWMAFVFNSYDNRFNELLNSIDNLAFNNMEERLVNYLQEQVSIQKSQHIDLSHQNIAYDMHTSRVVISRLLKNLENKGLVKLGRNKIEMI